MKVLLVGSSKEIGNYGSEFFEKAKDDGFKILSFANSIALFRKIGVKPDYFSFVDPWTIGYLIDFFEKDSFLNSTDLLIPNLFDNKFENFYKFGLTSSNLTSNPELLSRVQSLKFFDNFKNVFNYSAKCLDLREKVETRGSEFIRNLNVFSGFGTTNTDKLTAFLIPLVLYHFKYLKEIRTIGFGDFHTERFFSDRKGHMGGYQEFFDTFVRIMPIFKKYFEEKDIKISFETDNHYSKVYKNL